MIHAVFRIAVCLVGITVAASPVSAEDSKPLRILLIGNSYTGGIRAALQSAVNALPPDRKITMEFVTPGGRRLAQHLGNEKLMARIDDGMWDYVVLQEQSQLPSLPKPISDQFRNAAKTLCERIHSTGAKPVFFMTWGRRDGDKANPEINPDFATMQGRLSDSYRTAATKGKAVLLPVGTVFSRLHDSNGDLWKALYRNDGSHPSAKGGDVFACVFLFHLLKSDLVDVKLKTLSQSETESVIKAIKSTAE